MIEWIAHLDDWLLVGLLLAFGVVVPLILVVVVPLLLSGILIPLRWKKDGTRGWWRICPWKKNALKNAEEFDDLPTPPGSRIYRRIADEQGNDAVAGLFDEVAVEREGNLLLKIIARIRKMIAANQRALWLPRFTKESLRKEIVASVLSRDLDRDLKEGQELDETTLTRLRDARALKWARLAAEAECYVIYAHTPPPLLVGGWAQSEKEEENEVNSSNDEEDSSNEKQVQCILGLSGSILNLRNVPFLGPLRSVLGPVLKPTLGRALHLWARSAVAHELVHVAQEARDGTLRSEWSPETGLQGYWKRKWKNFWIELEAWKVCPLWPATFFLAFLVLGDICGVIRLW